MFKQLTIACLLSAACLSAQARDRDLELAAALTLHAADWLQTREIAANPQEFREVNKLLGEHPSIGRVNKYFAATAAIGIAAHYLLPEEYAIWSDRVWIVVEGGAVSHNLRLGIGFKF